jgi:TPR repeat protein
MRRSGYFLSVAVLGFGLGLATAYALDGTPSPANIAPVMGRVAPQGPLYSGNLRQWFRARQVGDIEAARQKLEEAARDGDVAAAWELGRIYADGDGVVQNHKLAFEYFSRIADSHADEPPGTAQARFVANSFVRLAGYYRTGIPNANIKPDVVHAREMFDYAAKYFGDRDAQYHLGRIYLDGQGVSKDTKQAARWLFTAANKGQYEAQAVFGALLFGGNGVPRDAARGLMYMVLALDAASSKETWIADLYASALKQATPDELTRALDLVKRWIEQSRSGRREQS